MMPQVTAGFPNRRKKMTDYATELEWLRYYRTYTETHYLPHDPMIEFIRQDFEKKTKKICPERA